MTYHLSGRTGPRVARFLILLVTCLAGIAGCDRSSPSSPTSPDTPSSSIKPPQAAAATPPKPSAAPPPPATSPLKFEEVARAAGIDFVHTSGMTPERYFPTANGSGVAVFDYDRDGRMDLYFATFNTIPLEPKPKGSNRLYRNLGDGKFQDVTEKSGLGFHGACHGVVVGDVDNDGDQDVFLANFGPNVLYLNNGDGTFRDVTNESGTDVDNWSSGGAFLDYDNDGDLDLYVANYGLWDVATDGQRWCGGTTTDGTKVRYYCSPKLIRTAPHVLYRNDGVTNGVPHFTDVTEAAGVLRKGDKGGHGFGVVACDLNGDGKIDLYVANDQNPAFTFINKGDGTFQDTTEQSGAGYDENGTPQSGMGADAEDIDGDGLPELVRTNFNNETTSFYQNLGGGQFAEQSAFLGISGDSLPWVKWGCHMLDFDNDGHLDLFVTNGHVDNNLEQLGMEQPYGQPPNLFLNVPAKSGAKGARRFRSVAKMAGPYFEARHVGRGSAWGDLDDDGRPDLVVNHKGDAPAVLMNRSDPAGRWLRLDLEGTKSNRDAIGAKLEITVDGRTIFRQKKGGTSMESAQDPRVLIGVGPAMTAKIVVRWPLGEVTTIDQASTNTTLKIKEPGERPAR